MAWLRRHYGAGPVHLVGLLACSAIAVYAVTRVLGESGWPGIFVGFVVCLILHDFVAWPVYSAADRLLLRPHRRAGTSDAPGEGTGPIPREGGSRKRPAVEWTNHVRFPTVISAVLLVMFFPLIFRISNAYYIGATGFSEDVYFVNWLAVTGVLFAGSAATYLLRLGAARARRSPRIGEQA
jgi:hypothetical protein